MPAAGKSHTRLRPHDVSGAFHSDVSPPSMVPGQPCQACTLHAKISLQDFDL